MWYFSLFFPSLFVPRITAKAQGSCVLLGVVTLCQGFVRCEVWLPYVKGGYYRHTYYFCIRYLYYFLKNENAHTKELLGVLEGLLSVDPTTELSEEYCKLATHKTGE